MANLIQMMTQRLETLVKGGTVGSNGLERFIDLYDGRAGTNLGVDQATKWMSKVFTAAAINFEWKRSHVYITASRTSDCEADDRGPSYLKVCDKGWPSTVFYVYRISPFPEEEGGNDYPRVNCPLNFK